MRCLVGKLVMLSLGADLGQAKPSHLVLQAVEGLEELLLDLPVYQLLL